jgi:hypothetical protein
MVEDDVEESSAQLLAGSMLNWSQSVENGLRVYPQSTSIDDSGRHDKMEDG